MYIIRALGGGLFLVGACIMAYNLVMTIIAAPSADEIASPGSAPAFAPAE